MHRFTGRFAISTSAIMMSGAARMCSTTTTPPKPAPVKVDIELIKELRFQTEAPLKDCKEALTQVLKDGSASTMSVEDIKKAAIVILHAKGVSRAAGKRERVTDFGVLVACQGSSSTGAEGEVAAMIQLCCETDFSAGNSRFAALGDTVAAEAQGVLSEMSAEVELTRAAWMTHLEGDQKEAPVEATDAEKAIINKVTEKCTASIAATSHALGENITIKRCYVLPAVRVVESEPRESDGVKFTSTLRVGVYAHSSTIGVSKFVGKTVGLVGIHCPQQQHENTPVVSSESLADLAQHCVANVGDTSKHVTLQQFDAVEVSGDQQSPTVNKWLKRHGCKYAASMVAEFGKQPIVSLPVVVPAQFQQKPKA